MSFTRLLAAGRSIMGLKKQPGPYRMNQEHLLPKFAAAKGEKAKPVNETAEAAPASAETPGVPASATEQRIGFLQRVGGKMSGLIGGLRRPDRKTVSSKSGRRAVQTELALGSLTVMRNDLKENDHEVPRTRDRFAFGKKEQRRLETSLR